MAANTLDQALCVFLPLWPSTYNSLRNHRLNLLCGANVFRIGSIKHDLLIENYDRAAIQRRANQVPRSSGRLCSTERDHVTRQG